MAHTKAGGTAKNLNDSNPKFLGIKLYGGEIARPGAVIVRQRGTRIMPGKNVLLGKDHTIYSTIEGTVSFGEKRVRHFDDRTVVKKTVSVLAASKTKAKRQEK